MQWHRWNGTEIIYEKRPYLYELPVLEQDISSYLSYPCGNDLAVSLSLCDGGKFYNACDQTNHTYHYPELLAKRLAWFVKHLCERTDIVESGVPLKVAITDDMYPLAMPYLIACNFPMDSVNWIKNYEAEYRWISKYEAMNHPSLNHIDKVLHIDISFLVGTHRNQRKTPLFRGILDRWSDQPIASSGEALFFNRGVYDWISIPRVESLANERQFNPESHVIWEEISSLYGGTIDEVYNFWTHLNPFPHIPGGIVGHTQAYLSDDKRRDRFKRLLKASCNDEVSLALQVYYEKLGHSDVVIINDMFPWEGYPHEKNPSDVFRFCTCQEDMPTDLFLDMHY